MDLNLLVQKEIPDMGKPKGSYGVEEEEKKQAPVNSLSDIAGINSLIRKIDPLSNLGVNKFKSNLMTGDR